MILKRMKRRHLREQSIQFCADMKAARPDIVFGADFIAGFPTETDAMFENTLALIDECDLTYLHIFPYSIRPGTPAARMPQVNGIAIKERAKLLRQAGDKKLNAFLDNQKGKTCSALIETQHTARSEQFAPIKLNQANLPTSLPTNLQTSLLPGTIVDVMITNIQDQLLVGELC
jgi:threonylcarbamoyladenosine tRNA methylthiotransferase MtaB